MRNRFLRSFLMSPWLCLLPAIIALVLLFFPGSCTFTQDAALCPRADNHSSCCLMLSPDHRLVGWGSNRQKLLGGILPYRPFLLRRTLMADVESVCCDDMLPPTVLVLTRDHTLYGLGHSGRLPSHEGDGPVPLMDHVISADIGGAFGSVTEDGSLYLWTDGSAPVPVMEGARKVLVSYYKEALALTENQDLYLIRFPAPEDPSAPDRYTLELLEHGIADLQYRGNGDLLLLTTSGGLRVLERFRPTPTGKSEDSHAPLSHTFLARDLPVEEQICRLFNGYALDRYGNRYLYSLENGKVLEFQPASIAFQARGLSSRQDIQIRRFGLFFTGLPIPRSFRFLNPTARNVLLLTFLFSEAAILRIRRRARRPARDSRDSASPD